MSSLKSQIQVFLGVVFFAATSMAFPALRDGGVSGGGGNVINPTPPRQYLDGETAEHIVKASFKYVELYIQDKEARYQSRQMSDSDMQIYSKIFSGQRNMAEVLNEVHPKVEDERPCYDFGRNPVDASVVSRKPNTFCVSAYSLAQKVIHTEIPIQSTALMVHEYSEILGLSEEEAVVLQTKALEDLKQMDLPPLEIHED